MTAPHRLFTTPFAKVYPFYVAKAERKGRTRAEVDVIICWLTGYTPKQLEKQLKAAEFKLMVYDKLIEVTNRQLGTDVLKKIEAKLSENLQQLNEKK
jgi:hypothetical protein